MNPDMALTYLDFVAERHAIWERRQAGQPAPWTTDPVLEDHKFTNVFRILDVGTQFVVRDLLFDSTLPSYGDALMRCFLYRYTNRPEPWQAFAEEYGRYPVRTDLEENLPSLWRDLRANGYPIFGNAYKMFSGAENKGMDRLTWITELTDRFFGFGPDDIVAKWADAETPLERLNVLKTIPRCADFMAMQIITDYGYWDPTYNENAFVVAGPGARVGAKLVSPEDKTGAATIAWAYGALASLKVPLLAGESPSMMDVQNTFCEFGKYVRYSGLPRKRQPYRAAHPATKPFLPPTWR